MSDDFNSILTMLSDGRSHPIDALSDELCAAEVETRLDVLEERGLRLDKASDEVRWLDSTPLLRMSAVSSYLEPGTLAQLAETEISFETTSTNSRIQRFRQSQQVQLCAAEWQSGGRGRRGNHWLAPPCTGLLFSLRCQFAAPATQLAGLSLAVGVAVASVLRALGIDGVGVKWPNDIYIGGSKLGGILVELPSVSAQRCEVVVGIGLNIQLNTIPAGVEQRWASLHQHYDGAIDRNQLLAQLLDRLVPMFVDYPNGGAEWLRQHWPDFDIAFGRSVTLHLGEQQYRGEGAGIDAAFRFLLRNTDNVRSFHSGDVSLRF